MLQGIRAMRRRMHHRLGLAALQIHAISRQLVRLEKHYELLSFVENMDEQSPFRRRPRQEPEAPPEA